MSLVKLAKKQLELCGVTDEKITVGFSGGSDSTALLYTLAECVGPDRLCAVHVNHGIRGEQADGDEAFCKSVCENLGVEFVSVHVDIPRVSKEEHTGLEECARKYRYRAFFDVSKQKNIHVIATAHNARDNAEAVLFNLCRGTGVKGISGIPVKRYEKGFLIIRPIIKADKADILDYLEKNNLSYVTDATNYDTDYTRNYIRHEILPCLSRINTAFVENISNFSDILSNTDEYISEKADEFIRDFSNNSTFEREPFLSLHKALSANVIQKLSGITPSYKMTELIYKFAENASVGQSMDVSAGTVLYHNGQTLTFSRRVSMNEYRYELHEGVNKFPDLGFTLYLFFDDSYKKENIYKTLKPTVINRDKINGNIFIRNRKEGDRYKYGGITRTPKKVLAAAKLPTQVRKNYPVVCDSKTVICMPGFPPCDGYNGRKSENKAVIMYQSDL